MIWLYTLLSLPTPRAMSVVIKILREDRNCLQLEVNLSKSSLAAALLQAHQTCDVPLALQDLGRMVPDLQELPGKTEGFVSVGILIGHLSFIDQFMTQKITDLSFRSSFPIPIPTAFCCYSNTAATRNSSTCCNSLVSIFVYTLSISAV
jgi:hypothetical protein